MRILYVAMDYFGNPDLVKMSTELAHRNHSINVATFYRTVDKQKDMRDVSIFQINPLLTIYSIGYKLAFPFAKIYRIIKERNIEIIHALGDYSVNTALAAFVSRLTNIPFVYTIQGVDFSTESLVADTLMELYNRTVEHLITKNAKRVILLSRRLAPRAREFGAEESKLVTIPSGIDHAYFDPKRIEVERKAASLREELRIGDSIVVGYVGRLIPAKGLSYLVSAVRQLQHEHPNVCLIIVGDGPERADLEMIAKDSQIKTIFTGWQVDTLPFYALMDIFVLPSLFEGLPNVVLEAMAMEKPVVATDVGGNPDLVMNGKNGFLVPVRDTKGIATALEELIENDDLRNRMGVLSRQIAKEVFSWDKIVGKVETIYNEIV